MQKTAIRWQSNNGYFLWAQLGLNQRPLDYESSATNQLSYGPETLIIIDLGLQRYNFV